MKVSQIAAQLYTVRDFCRTAGELATTAQKIRDIGYTAVQLSGLGAIPESEITAIMREEHLAICASHEPAHDILEQTDAVLARLARLGCKLCAYPYPREVDLTNGEQIARLISGLDAAGKKFRAAGCQLVYHNHAVEFMKFEGRTILERIFAETETEHLGAELDIYWVQLGGGDPVAWCEKMSGRLPAIHLKDYIFNKSNVPQWCELGNGNLDLPRIVAAAEKSGCRWFIVEQDTCPGDPFASLQASFRYLLERIAEK